MESSGTSLDSGNWVWPFPIIDKQCGGNLSFLKVSDLHELDADAIYSVLRCLHIRLC